MQFLETVIGVVAAMLTSPLYISQVKKVRACQPTEDLSVRTLIAPTSGWRFGWSMVPSRQLDHHRGKPGWNKPYWICPLP
jgi:hypothetical protein